MQPRGKEAKYVKNQGQNRSQRGFATGPHLRTTNNPSLNKPYDQTASKNEGEKHRQSSCQFWMHCNPPIGDDWNKGDG